MQEIVKNGHGALVVTHHVALIGARVDVAIHRATTEAHL
jgi:hypothetical protein